MFEDRYIARNPYLAAPSPRVSIAADGPAAEIYRASPVEPWRVLRTRLRVAGKVPGPIEGGGRASGYFTGATGITIYRGDAWPAAWDGLAVMGDACTNLAHRKRLEPNGLETIARRIDQNAEFVASKDIWFRPVQFANAPDGTLYIADMYREVIEHPLSLPPAIKRHLDLTSGRDRGRIYRVVPDGFAQRPLPQLGAASTPDLVATLAHANGWHRETAARLLYQRRDQEATPALETLAVTSPAPRGGCTHCMRSPGSMRYRRQSSRRRWPTCIRASASMPCGCPKRSPGNRRSLAKSCCSWPATRPIRTCNINCSSAWASSIAAPARRGIGGAGAPRSGESLGAIGAAQLAQ